MIVSLAVSGRGGVGHVLGVESADPALARWCWSCARSGVRRATGKGAAPMANKEDPQASLTAASCSGHGRIGGKAELLKVTHYGQEKRTRSGKASKQQLMDHITHAHMSEKIQWAATCIACVYTND